MAKQYKELNKAVKTAVTWQKIKNKKAMTAMTCLSQRNVRRGRKTYNAVEDKKGNIHTSTAEVPQCLKDHF